MHGNEGQHAGSKELSGTPDSGKRAEQQAAVAVRPLVPGMRYLLFVAAVLVLLAGFQLFVFTERTDTFFAWTIVRFSARQRAIGGNSTPEAGFSPLKHCSLLACEMMALITFRMCLTV